MILSTLPPVLYTGLKQVIGKPEDYLAMVLKFAKIAVRKVDSTIPASAQLLSVDSTKSLPAGIVQQAAKEEELPLVALKDLTEQSVKWRIKVRLTKKGDRKPCRKGESIMQNLQFADRDGTEMPALLFGDIVVEKGESLVEGQVRI